jgi:hypothetical protein
MSLSAEIVPSLTRRESQLLGTDFSGISLNCRLYARHFMILARNTMIIIEHEHDNKKLYPKAILYEDDYTIHYKNVRNQKLILVAYIHKF